MNVVASRGPLANNRRSSAREVGIHVLHVINGLSTGGAETMLYRLVEAGDRSRFRSSVISLLDGGTFGPKLTALGIPVHCLGMQRGLPPPGKAIRLRRLIQTLRPDVIQGWMYHGNLATLLGARRTPVLWNIRHSLHSLDNEAMPTRLAIRAGSVLSGRPQRILYNAAVSARQHESIGYRAKKTLIIPNGFDHARYKPDAAARHSVRAELGVGPNTLLVGHIGRYHPTKDHAALIAAAPRLDGCYSKPHFVFAGRDVDENNAAIAALINQTGCADRIHLLGERNDVPRIMAALDVFCSTSWGEGFPNVIAEAMACGIPCVATDVGDSRLIVDDHGRIVPPGDGDALIDGIKALLYLSHDVRASIGKAARQRVMQEFSLSTVVEMYEAVYERAATQRS